MARPQYDALDGVSKTAVAAGTAAVIARAGSPLERQFAARILSPRPPGLLPTAVMAFRPELSVNPLDV